MNAHPSPSPVLGLVTIGQAPRADLADDLPRLLGGVRPVQHGALDDDRFDGPDAERTRERVGPAPGEAPLISRLRDGRSVVLGHDALLPRIKNAVARCEADGAGATLLLCTGNFPAPEDASRPVSRPLLYAEPLFQQGVRAMVGDEPVGVVCPLPEQADDVRERWSRLLPGAVRVAPADPYAEDAPARTAAAARELATAGCRRLVLDCIGYTEATRGAAVDAAGGVPVLLARAVALRLAAEAAYASGAAAG